MEGSVNKGKIANDYNQNMWCDSPPEPLETWVGPNHLENYTSLFMSNFIKIFLLMNVIELSTKNK